MVEQETLRIAMQNIGISTWTHMCLQLPGPLRFNSIKVAHAIFRQNHSHFFLFSLSLFLFHFQIHDAPGKLLWLLIESEASNVINNIVTVSNHFYRCLFPTVWWFASFVIPKIRPSILLNDILEYNRSNHSRGSRIYSQNQATKDVILTKLVG